MSLFTAGKGGGGFQRLPEGNQIVRVKAIEFDADFFTDTSMEVFVVFENEQGIVHKDRFDMATSGGQNAMTFTLKVINNNYKIEEGEALDPYMASAIGKFIEVDVEHLEAKDKFGELIKTKKGEQIINVRLNNKKHSEGWLETVSTGTAQPDEETKYPADSVDSPAGFSF